jgi:hypoxia up-regulated 1
VPKTLKGLAKWKNEIDDLTEKKPWITEDEKNDVLEKIADMNSWLEDKVKEQSKKTLMEDAHFTAKDVEDKFKPVERLYKRVVEKKKPKET